MLQWRPRETKIIQGRQKLDEANVDEHVGGLHSKVNRPKLRKKKILFSLFAIDLENHRTPRFILLSS